jgi:hypothetical protein
MASVTGALVGVLLALAGAGLIVTCFVVRDELSQVSITRTCTDRLAKPSGDCSTPGRVETTEKTPSDALLGTLLVAGTLMVFAGAFFPRVRGLTLPGGAGVEIGAAQDANTVAEVVAEKVREQVRAMAAVTPQQAGPALTVELAAKAAAASAIAQQEVARLRAAAAYSPESAPVKLTAGDIGRVRRGMPLSRETLKELASTVVEDVFEEGEPPSAGARDG